MPAAIGACGTVVAAVAAVFAAGAVNDGPSTAPQDIVVVTNTPAPTTPGSTPTLTPGETPDRSHAIVAGSWDFRYTVLSNNCGFGSFEGQRIDYSLQIIERYPDDGYIDEGDDAQVLDAGFHLGYIELTYPEFGFQYPISANGYNGTADVQITFEDSESGRGYRKDTYDDGFGNKCSIVAEDH
jgi:hypothetical protein